MATLAQIRDKANAKLATLWAELQTRQNAYFAKHGKYFQLLAGSNLVADGVDVPFTMVPPSDETKVVDLGGAWNDSVPFKIQVDSFESEANRGYTATVWVQLLNGDIYTRSRTYLDTRKLDVNQDKETKVVTKNWVGVVPTEIDSGWSQVASKTL